MIAPTLIFALLLAGPVLAEQPQGEVSNVQSVPIQPHVVDHGVVSEVGQPPVEHPAHQQPQIVHQPQYYSPSGVVQVVGSGEQQPGSVPQYAAAGVKPQQSVVLKQQGQQQFGPGAEQYGHPESAAIPPNYKPWGSWGLYIGGNPADGYYSSYYKALSQSVADKQQVGAVSGAGDSKPVSGSQGVVGQASGFSGQSPLLKQAGNFPYNYQDQGYPYDSSYYTPADLNSGSRVSVAQGGVAPYPGSAYVPSVYANSPVSYYGVEQPSAQGGLSYAAGAIVPDMYGTKRLGQSSSYGTKQQAEQKVAQAPAKGYQQQQHHYYSYASPVVYQSPAVQPQQQGVQQSQVIAYPVPVGSQIVGSQPGVEGSFQPFGVHGFTRYAIKPTVVAGEAQQQQYHHGVHSAPVSQFPVYKQAIGYQQPLSFYGYPLSQLHYSQGSISPAFGPQSSSSHVESSSSGQSSPQVGVIEHSPSVHGPLGMPAGVQVEAASSEKSESKVEQAVNKQANKPSQQ